LKPHSFSTVRVSDTRSPEQRFADLGPFAKRHGLFPKGTKLPATQQLACPRVKMSDFPAGFIPERLYAKATYQNQLAASCCRHPENHEIAAFKSHPDEKVPDTYILYCTCGRRHINFGVWKHNEQVPVWDAS
jgi:hypothetical protein